MAAYIILFAEVLGALILIASTAWSAVKYVVPFIRRVTEGLTTINQIHAEFRPNGGSSVRDTLNNIEGDIRLLKDESAKADARHWSLISSIDSPVWESDKHGKCFRANRALLALTGRTREEMMGNGWENIVFSPDKQRVYVEWESAVNKRRAFESSYRVTNINTDEVFLVRSVATPINDAQGGLAGWIGSFEDVERVDA